MAFIIIVLIHIMNGVGITMRSSKCVEIPTGAHCPQIVLVQSHCLLHMYQRLDPHGHCNAAGNVAILHVQLFSAICPDHMTHEELAQHHWNGQRGLPPAFSPL